jgi:hypothetical protein
MDSLWYAGSNQQGAGEKGNKMGYAGWAFVVAGFTFAFLGFMAGRYSVANQVKFVENQTYHELEVALDKHGVLIISE